MNYISMDKHEFLKKYLALRDKLSGTARKFIETMFMFIGSENSTKNKISKDEILKNLEDIDEAINHLPEDRLFYTVHNSYVITEFKVMNNENYIDPLIKLNCAVGIYPDDFFLKRSKKIFYNEIYSKIMDDTFNEDYIFCISKEIEQNDLENHLSDKDLSENVKVKGYQKKYRFYEKVEAGA